MMLCPLPRSQVESILFICMLLELAGLGGREKLPGRSIDSVVVFPSA